MVAVKEQSYDSGDCRLLHNSELPGPGHRMDIFNLRTKLCFVQAYDLLILKDQ